MLTYSAASYTTRERAAETWYATAPTVAYYFTKPTLLITLYFTILVTQAALLYSQETRARLTAFFTLPLIKDMLQAKVRACPHAQESWEHP